MSAKWRRSLEWERRNLTGPLTPVRWVVHTLSTIWFAVIVLIGVSLFGIAASVPVGVLALAPTWGFYGLTLVATILLFAGVGSWVAVRGLRNLGMQRAGRFTVGVLVALGAGVLGVWLWASFAWPALHFNPATGTGVRFFGSFIDQYSGVTVRRLPALEMSELEFYAWWPLTTLLVLFVINMIVATVRRIEFRFEYLGVLSVHSGLVIMALGSAFYGTFKREGDTLLIAGPPDAQGQPTLGPVETGFFDNTIPALLVHQQGKTSPTGNPLVEHRPIVGLPRYNDYNLNALEARLGRLPPPKGSPGDQGRTLDLLVPSAEPADAATKKVDPDIEVRVVGYAAYADPDQAWETSLDPGGGRGGAGDQPLRIIKVQASRTLENGQVQTRDLPPLEMRPLEPASRAQLLFQNLFQVEYVRGLSPARWDLLTQPMPTEPPLPSGQTALHALRVALPGQPARLLAVEEGSRLTLDDPQGGVWTLEVRSIRPAPSLPFITKGYEGATSPEVTVRVTPPPLPPAQAAGDAPKPAPFDRIIFARFPELNQDLGTTPRPDGRMDRRAPDERIIIEHLDGSVVQVVFDETAQGSPRDPDVRAVVRLPGQPPRVLTALKTGGKVTVGGMVTIDLLDRYAHAERVLVPAPVRLDRRTMDKTGNHTQAMVAVEVRQVNAEGVPVWSRREWVPFTKFRPLSPRDTTTFRLPDGRALEVTFGRLWRPLPDMWLQLADFEMYPYPHSTQPRDFKSTLRLTRIIRDESGAPIGTRESTEHTSLNEPLLASPYVADAHRGAVLGLLAWVADRLGPNRYKFSQAGWDAQGWNDTKAAADAGRMPRPVAKFTILGVGNNPGIYIIAAGAVMMCLGVPWAFYVKPWIVRRRARRVAQQVRAGTYVKPARRSPASSEPQQSARENVG